MRLSQHRGGAGEPLVLLHGIGGTWHQWEPVLPHLEERCDVLALDLPGFGDSPPDAERGATIPAQADAVEGALDDAGFSSAHLAGNSSGGWLALELARRGRARSVVALAPAGMWTRPEETYRYLHLRSAHSAAKLLARTPALTRPAAARWALGWWLYNARPGRWSAEQAVEQTRALGAASSYVEFLSWTRHRTVDGLEEVDCPVLICWGSRDLLLPRRQAHRFIARLPNSSFRLLPGVGHVPMADDPELVASAVLEFADRSSGPTPASRSWRSDQSA